MPREYREERLQRTLREQLYEQIEGVVESVIVTNNGLVVAAYPAPSSEDEAHNEPGGSYWVAALAAEIIAQSKRAFGRLSVSTYQSLAGQSRCAAIVSPPVRTP